MMKFEINLIRTLSVEESVPVIIYLKNYRPEALKKRGIEITASFPFINAVACEMNSNDIRPLFLDSNISYVAEQNVVSALGKGGLWRDRGKKVRTLAENEASFNELLLKSLHEKGGTLAVIDTGICPHIDFMMPKIRIKAFLDLVGGKQYPYDDNGHGTFVASVTCANGISTAGEIVGTAPSADIVAIKAMNEKGEGGTVKLLEAMQWIMDNRYRLGVTVVCMSFGCTPQKSDPLARGAQALVNAGLTVVCASGNSGEDNVLSPAVADTVISVGACDKTKNPANFTSRGIVRGRIKPDFYAPGVGIRGLSHKTIDTKMSGTSVACPYVAGLCLRLKRQNPFLTPLQIKSALYRQAERKNSIYLL